MEKLATKGARKRQRTEQVIYVNNETQTDIMGQTQTDIMVNLRDRVSSLIMS